MSPQFPAKHRPAGGGTQPGADGANLPVASRVSWALGSPQFPLWGSPCKPPDFSHFPPTLGLRRIHALTTQATYELHVDLEDFDNGTAYARYGSFAVGLFSVDPEEDGYPLTVADYSGTAGRIPGHRGLVLLASSFKSRLALTPTA